jgi:hypothetical protein
MALMLIIAGACLALGGLLGLLSGFDAMTTERGAAATIAGVTALSGGLIAIGLGCVVARLSQILTAYEDDSEERIAAALNADAAPPPASAAISAPAPLPVTPPEPAPMTEPEPTPVTAPTPIAAAQTEDDTLLRNPLNRSDKPEAVEPESKRNTSTTSRLLARLGRNKGALATGSAAGAAIAGTAAVLAAGKTPEPKAEELARKAEEEPQAKVEHERDEPLERPTVAPEPASAPEFVSAPDLLSETDRLEAELAKALKEDLETSAPADPEPVVEQVTEPVPAPKATRGRRKFSEMLEPKPASAPEIVELATEPTEVTPSTAEIPDTVSESINTVAEAIAERAIDSTNPESNEAAVEPEQAPAEPEDLKDSSPAILGRYVRDGHTYTLYADGSVDALTEAGVKRYASMEELRRELTKA